MTRWWREARPDLRHAVPAQPGVWLVIEYFETEWSVHRRTWHARGGGWRSVRQLQANLLARGRSQLRTPWLPNPERCILTRWGGLYEKRDDSGAWVPYCQVELAAIGGLADDPARSEKFGHTPIARTTPLVLKFSDHGRT